MNGINKHSLAYIFIETNHGFKLLVFEFRIYLMRYYRGLSQRLKILGFSSSRPLILQPKFEMSMQLVLCSASLLTFKIMD